MSDDATPGATAILNQPPIEALSPDQARERIETLKQSESFNERVAKRDISALDEWQRLWNQVRGVVPPPDTAEGVVAQMEARRVAEAESHAGFLRARGATEDQIFEIQNNRPIPVEERRIHEAQRQRFLTDKAWQQRWRDGDAQARAEETLNAYALKMPIGTQEQIAEWERAHGRR